MTKKTRFEVFKRDSFTCQYCGRSAPEVILRVDHMKPVSKDGDDDLLNLITACFDCNAGKSDRLLSDNSTVQKQKAQLDELNERREQLEMMIQWRSGLRSLDAAELDAVCDAWAELVYPFGLSEQGKLGAKKLLKKFGLNVVLSSIEKSVSYLRLGADDKYTSESVEVAWKKVGGICRMDTLPEWKQKIYHIRNIARKRSGEEWYPQTSAEILHLFEEAYREGDTFDQLEDLATRGISYRELPDVLRQWIKQSKEDRKREARAQAEAEREAPTTPEYFDQGINAAYIDELQESGELEN